ncbi:3-hydroxyacyl-CoA dehydrogenase [Metarhizium guizhouense ARSEF 977]|uniref:3-hydroxyacyl-CoA dehydrogenase n=1 Tax=Metarhizium guizhouense (strain ARSEF 977) TaxID=1276136 RepID=A0A0B4G4I1_METGA|nr:3-hydroxyacyl-CoA dehydrogenase [Metarhizium guizhouense ARSEF 977]
MSSASKLNLLGHIALIGLGEIGISFAALYLGYTNSCVHVFDTRSDLESHISAVLPGYLDSHDSSTEVTQLRASGRLKLCSSVEEACAGAAIVHEQGPENLAFKRSIWVQIEACAPPTTYFWSSTSGIPASLQNQDMAVKTRLLVVHPFNPPHIVPLIEIVPSKNTAADQVTFAKDFFAGLGSGHRPIVVQKEVPGFVANRLAYAMLREACSLVDQGVCSVQDVDEVVMASVGPRWAVQGLFNSYNMGGGAAGLQHFFNKLAGTIQDVWDSSAPVDFNMARSTEPATQKVDSNRGWESNVVRQTHEAYGYPTPAQYKERDIKLIKVVALQ